MRSDSSAATVDRLDLASLVAGRTLIWYDGPRLFTTTDAAGRVYLALFVNDTDSTETYLYAPISAVRLATLEAGDMALRDAFTAPDGQVWRVMFDYTAEATADVAAVNGAIPEAWLPAAGVSLHRKATTGSVQHA